MLGIACSRLAVNGFVIVLLASCTAASSASASPAQDEPNWDVAKVSMERVVSPVELGATTPPPETSIWKTFVEGLKAQLRDPHGQYVNVGVASVAGLILLVNGEFIFKWMLVGAVFILAMLIALHDVTAAWNLEYGSPLRRIISIEAGACCAYAAYRGINGVMNVVGVMVGAALAHGTRMVFLEFGNKAFETNQWLIIGWYTVFTLALVVVMERQKHLMTLAVACPVLGGALVSSAASWGVTFLAENGMMPWLDPAFPGLKPPTTGAWVDYWLLLTDSQAQDVGIFTGSQYQVALLGHEYFADRVGGCILWFLLFVVGACLQVRCLKKKKRRAMAKNKAHNNNNVANAALKEPILKDAV